jgi:hypothetical protein
VNFTSGPIGASLHVHSNSRCAVVFSRIFTRSCLLRFEGLGNRDIARELNLSEHTIKKYLYRIFEKLGISTRVELVLYAVNNGDPRHAEWLAGASRIAPSA